MKKLFQIAGILIVYCLVCGQGCNDRATIDASGEHDREISTRDSIRGIFSSGVLPQATLLSYQEAAMEKLSDLSDYLRIHSATTTSTVFKNKSADMIRELFSSEQVVAGWAKNATNGSKNVKLSELLDNPGLVTREVPVFDSMLISEPLQRQNDTVYIGKLTFRLRFAATDSTVGAGSRRGVAGFYAIRRLKVIGHDSIRAWRVYLGDIE